MRNIWKKSFSFGKKKKVSPPTPIPKLDLSFGSRYRNLVLVVHYPLKSISFSFSTLSLSPLPIYIFSSFLAKFPPHKKSLEFILRDTSLGVFLFLINLHQKASNVQVNLCQKHSFLNQLTHNMTTDCSLILQVQYKKIASSEPELSIFLYWTRNSMNNLPSYCGLTVSRMSATEKDLTVKIMATI